MMFYEKFTHCDDPARQHSKQPVIGNRHNDMRRTDCKVLALATLALLPPAAHPAGLAIIAAPNGTDLDSGTGFRLARTVR